MGIPRNDLRWLWAAAFLALVGVARADLGPSLIQKQHAPFAQIRVVVVLDGNSAPSTVRAREGASDYPSVRADLDIRNRSITTSFLDDVRRQGIDVEVARSYWLAPMLVVDVAAADLQRIAELPGVAAVIENAPLIAVEPVRTIGAQTAVDATAVGQDAVGVREVWQAGITGKGTLIASIDTGVDGLHPALSERYRGRHAASASTWRDPDGGTFPNDEVGHGTHTLGTAIGRAAADTIGIAPDAEWIAAGVVDRHRTFSQTIQDLLDAFQWLADPDGNPETVSDVPDVVVNSWGIPQGVLPACDATFWQMVDNLEALGTFVVFAAGNEGPSLGTLRQPADRGDAPLKCFSVGAVDAVASPFVPAPFSARGPVTCNPTIVKPEILAPGVNVRSAMTGGGYAYLTGTSMAAPYVAGAVLLLRQYNPDATPDQIKQALIGSATDLGAEGPDNESGYGLLNISGAMDLLPAPRPLAWEWTVPTLPDPGLEEFELTSTPASLVMHNEGRSLEALTIDIRTLREGDIIAGNDRFEFDHVAFETGELELPLDFSSDEMRSVGDRIFVELHLQSAASSLDTVVYLGIPIGTGPAGAALSVAGRDIQSTATNFGRFDPQGGLALDVESGFSWKGRPIDFAGGLRLRHHGIDGSSYGLQRAFEPAPAGLIVSGDQRHLATTLLRDTRAAEPAFLEFRQEVIAGTGGPGDYLIYAYDWTRLVPAGHAVFPGAWFEWNPDGTETATCLPTKSGVMVEGDGLWLGAVWLGDAATLDVFAHDPERSELPQPGTGVQAAQGDRLLVTITGVPRNTPQGHFGVAIVGAESRAEWEDAALRARGQYARLTGAGGEEEVRPESFGLSPNYPNPFNPSTRIHYTLDRRQHVTLEIYNLLGRRIATLVDRIQEPGSYDVSWDARGGDGDFLASGTYFARLKGQDVQRTIKMTLLR